MQALEVEAGNHPPEDPEIAAFLEARFLAHDPEGLAAMARLLATEPDRTDDLVAALGTPAGPGDRVLVAFGEDDDAWSPEIQRETASRLGAPAVSFPEAAHSPAAEAPGPTATDARGVLGEIGGSGAASPGGGGTVAVMVELRATLQRGTRAGRRGSAPGDGLPA